MGGGLHFYFIFYYFILFLFIFFGHTTHAACGILVPRTGIEPVPPAVEARSPNHCTAREVLGASFLKEV